MIRQRCAIYTRKSTEEGLEQSFNSLDAQREACSAYVTSQRHEGWSELPDRYDDGGYSGGSMDRPGLGRLLADIAAGRIDVVVVYKVDRLTRALSDFAKMVEIFDASGVSFVSVTQAFNTISSMGRLTLNVLLSFAQFEREVTAERIRDKVAASKRKGMWMGGAVPFGYRAENKALVVESAEAESVRTIYAEYLELGSVRALRGRLDALGIVSRRRVDRHGRVTGGAAFSRGALYHLLRNPLYAGKVRQGGEVFDGLHAAIVDEETWAETQNRLDAQGGGRIAGRRGSAQRCLDGILIDAHGRPMRTTYAQRAVMQGGTRRTKRYCYYVSRPEEQDPQPVTRLPAQALEHAVAEAIAGKIADRAWLLDRLREVTAQAPAQLNRQRIAEIATKLASEAEDERVACLHDIVRQIDLAPAALRITLDIAPLMEGADDATDLSASLEIPYARHQNGRARPIVIWPGDAPRRDPDLITLVADARRWMAELLAGEATTAAEITTREGLRKGAVSRILPLAWLAPDIATAILEGRQPASLTAKRLRDLDDLPLCWQEQRELLGFPDV